MFTVREVAAKVAASLDSDLGDDIIADWVRERVAQVVNALPVDYRRKEHSFLIDPLVSTAGATFTNLSSEVTLDATAQTALAGKLQQGDELRLANARERYTVVSFDTDSIEIDPPFQQATSSTGTLERFRRLYDVPPGCREIESIRHSRAWLLKVTPEFLEQRYPDRKRYAAYPHWWAIHGRGPSGRVQIELYPTPREDPILVRMTYIESAESLGLDDYLPAFFDIADIKVGVSIDLATYESARLARKSEESNMDATARSVILQASQTWLNAASRRRSEWEAAKDDLISKASLSQDDGQITVLKGPSGDEDPRIRTAKHHVDDLGQDL